MTFLKWLCVLLVCTIFSAMPGLGRAEDAHKPLLVGTHQINHVFIIVLENKGFDETFGPNSEAPYLAKDLPAQGVLLKQYFGTGHASLDNYIAMISGLAATKETRADCQTFEDFKLDTSDKNHPNGKDDDGQWIGKGCVYPSNVPTLADQLTKSGKTWRAYMEDMGNDPRRESAVCGHPQIGTADRTQHAEGRSASVRDGDQYAARHDPFMYFHSIIDDEASCASHVVNLDHLEQDLASKATTANFTFVTPNLCNDGHDDPCIVDNRPGGLPAINEFLRKWVPIITRSPAYQDDGLLIVTFDEADFDNIAKGPASTVYTENGEACCNQKPGSNIGTFPQSDTSGTLTFVTKSFGGDRMGAVLLSPFLVPGTVSNTPFNHYSLLKTVEDLFGLDYLGYAGQTGLVGFFGCVASDVAVKDDPKAGQCKAR